jgi:hypothetical protein
MRRLLFALPILLAGYASAQPTFGVGVGASADCGEVSRQIIHDWFDLRDFMSSDASVKRPTASKFQCVSPAAVSGAQPRRTGSSLRCYTVNGAGVCCDAQLQSCATL